jgi:hypothetical protein
MELDLECFRYLLEQMAEKPDYTSPLHLFQSPWNDDKQHYHLHMLRCAGFIRADEREVAGGRIYVRAYDLTCEGLELWASMHSKTLWNRMLTHAHERGVPVTLSTLRPLGKVCLQALLDGPTTSR